MKLARLAAGERQSPAAARGAVGVAQRTSDVGEIGLPKVPDFYRPRNSAQPPNLSADIDLAMGGVGLGALAGDGLAQSIDDPASDPTAEARQRPRHDIEIAGPTGAAARRLQLALGLIGGRPDHAGHQLGEGARLLQRLSRFMDAFAFVIAR